MFIRVGILILTLSLTGFAHAQEFCVRPLTGAESVSDIEDSQPRRLVRHPNIIPGYNGIVFAAYDSKRLLHYNGTEFLEITDDFPHLSGFAHKNIHLTPNSDAYGFGSKPKGIFYLPKGAEDWERVSSVGGYKRRMFDKGTGDVIFWSDGSWKRIHKGEIVGELDLPEEDYKLITHVQTVPDVDGTFAFLRRTASINERRGAVWFKPNDGIWKEIDIPSEKMGYFSHSIDIHVSGNLIRILDRRQKQLLFLTVTKNDLKFLGTAPEARWTKYGEDGDLLAWVGKSEQKIEKRRFFGLLRAKQKVIPPKLSIIREGSVTQEILSYDVEPRQTAPKGTVFYFTGIYSDPSSGRSFVHTSTGLGMYDGKTFLVPEGLSDSNSGKGSLKFLSGETYIQSKKGVFKLTKTLDVNRIDTFPIPEPWGHQVEIEYLKMPGLYLISDQKSKSFYTSSDMESYTEVGSEYKVDRIRAVLNEPPAAILSGQDGLYNFSQNCQAAK